MSALVRAMEQRGVAALARAVWTAGSDKVNFGALTPYITDEGDFLLFTPLPYSEAGSDG
jgi:ATP-dependent DNA helicase 2 subunit 2